MWDNGLSEAVFNLNIEARRAKYPMIPRQIIDAFPRYLIRDRDTAYGVAGETVPRIHPGRFPDRAPLRRDGARPCPLAQTRGAARPHDLV